MAEGDRAAVRVHALRRPACTPSARPAPRSRRPRSPRRRPCPRSPRPVLREQLARRRDRALQHRHGIDADERRVDDARARREAEALHRVARGEQHRRRAVGHLRRGARGVEAALDHGLQATRASRARSRAGPRRARRARVSPVGLPSASTHGRVDRQHLALVAASRAQARAASCWLRRPKRSVSCARDAVLLRDQLRALELRVEGVAREVALRHRAAEACCEVRAERDAAHASRRRRRARRPRAPSRRARSRASSPAGSSRTGCRRWSTPTSSGSPAESQAVRATLKDCSPTCETQPPITWPTAPASMPARSTQACCTAPSRSAGMHAREPAAPRGRAASGRLRR